MGKSIIEIVLELLDIAFDLLSQHVQGDFTDSLVMLQDTIQHIKDGALEE